MQTETYVSGPATPDNRILLLPRRANDTTRARTNGTTYTSDDAGWLNDSRVTAMHTTGHYMPLAYRAHTAHDTPADTQRRPTKNQQKNGKTLGGRDERRHTNTPQTTVHTTPRDTP